jgi:transcription elongation factor Elf1
MADFKSAAVRARIAKEIICPQCNNSNTAGKLLIQVDDKGMADCGYCGHGWVVQDE